jgi:hypothetical protein
VRHRARLVDTGLAAALAAVVLLLAPGPGVVALIVLLFAVFYAISLLASVAGRRVARLRGGGIGGSSRGRSRWGA